METRRIFPLGQNISRGPEAEISRKTTANRRIRITFTPDMDNSNPGLHFPHSFLSGPEFSLYGSGTPTKSFHPHLSCITVGISTQFFPPIFDSFNIVLFHIMRGLTIFLLSSRYQCRICLNILLADL